MIEPEIAALARALYLTFVGDATPEKFEANCADDAEFYKRWVKLAYEFDETLQADGFYVTEKTDDI